MKKILAIALLIFLVGYAVWSFISPNERGLATEIGDQAPDFELQTLNGETVRLSDFKGKKVFLNFWATWCPPCREEMPDIQKISETYKDDIVILAINDTSTEKNVEAVSEFLNKRNLTFQVALDKDGKITRSYNLNAFPTSYVIDEKGVIKHKYEGQMSYEMIESFIK